MASWIRAAHLVKRWTPVLLMTVALAACSGTSGQYPQSTLHPQSEFARMLDGVFMTTVWTALVVFVLVEGALVWVIFRYRGKPGDAEPSQVHGNTFLEVVWTAIPALILAIIAVPTVKAIFETYKAPPVGQALQVDVIGHQWWWEFRYPEYGLVTANELHVPVGRTVTLRMKTADVLHSFWVPQFAGKRDVFQNRITTLWFTADSTGYFSGQCAEFCGLQHARMAFHVLVSTAEEFDAFVKGLEATKPATDTAATVAADSAPTPVVAAANPAIADSGKVLFETRGCTACHVLDATNQANMVGPNLANVGSRRHIAAGVLLNTDENLARWIRDPQSIKVGVKMPVMGLTEEQASAVAAYLRTHR